MTHSLLKLPLSSSLVRIGCALGALTAIVPCAWANTPGRASPAPPLMAAANPESDSAHVLADSCAQPVYPPEAHAAGLTGSVLLSIAVTADGRAEKVDVTQSSGNVQLDQAAVEGMRQCRFVPATRKGVAVASVAPLRYTFRIDNSTPEQIAAQNQLRAVVLLQGMQKRIDAVTGNCAKLEGLVADNAKAAAKQWHARNDTTLRQTLSMEEALFATARSQSKDQKVAAEAEARSRKAIDAATDQAAAAELAGIVDAGDEKDSYCQIFNSQTVGGDFDLKTLYPELVEQIEAISKKPTANGK